MEFFLLYVEPYTRSIANATTNAGIWLWLELNSIVIAIVGYVIFMAAFSLIFAIIFLLGIGGTVVQAEQRKVFGTLEDAAATVGESWNKVSPTIRSLLDCAEPVFVFANFILEILSEVTFIVTKALNGLDSNFDVLFTWAERSSMENALDRLNAQQRANTLVEQLLADAQYKLPNMTATERNHYLKIVKYEVNKISDVHRNSVRTPLLISAVCSIIEAVGSFIIDLILIVKDMVLNFIDFVLTNFFSLEEGLTGTLIEIVVSFLIEEILDQIPFAACFRAIPSSIFECLCPWVYESPVLDLGFLSGDTEVPADPVKALIGCICVVDIILDGNVDLDDPDQDYKDLIFECIGLDVIIDILESVLGWINAILGPIIKALQVVFNVIRGIVDGILSVVEGLLDAFDSLCDAFGCKREISDLRDDMSFHRESLRTLDVYVEHQLSSEKMEELVTKHLLNMPGFARVKKEIDYDGTRVGYKIEILKKHLNQANSTYSEFTRQVRKQFDEVPVGERIARVADKYNSHPKVQEYRSYITEKYGVNSSVHAETLVRTFQTFLHGISNAARNKRTSMRHEFRNLDISGFYTAVKSLAKNIRAYEGYTESPLEKKLEMRTKMLRSALEGGDSFPRTIEYLTDKYGHEEPMLIKTMDEFGESFEKSVPGAKKIRSILSLNGTYEFELQLLKTRLNILRQNHSEYREETERLEDIYKTTARDPFTVSVLVGANAFSSAFSLTASMVAPAFGFDDIKPKGDEEERIVPVGLAFAFAPLVFLAQVFLTAIIGLLTTIASGLLIRISDGNDEAEKVQAFDFFYPFYARFENLVEESFVNGNGFSFSDATAVLSDIKNDLPIQLETSAIYFVRNYLCPLPNFLCPPVPKVDYYGLGTQGIFEWGRDTIISCNPEQTCLYTDVDNNNPCRCPVDGSRQEPLYTEIEFIPKQRWGTVDDPCYCAGTNYLPCGRIHCYPFLPTGIQFPDLDVDAEFDTKCDEEFGLYIDEVAFYKADSFWQYIWANMYNTLLVIRHILRYAYRGVFVNWYLIFLAAMLAVIPCPCFSFIAITIFQLLIILNIGSLVTMQIGLYIDEVSHIQRNAFLFGPAFRWTNENIRFTCGDYDENIFGDACPGENVCMSLALIGSTLFTVGWVGMVGMTSLFFWMLGLPALIYGIINVFMVIPYLIFLFFYMIYFSLFLYQHGIAVSGVIVEDVDADYKLGSIKHVGEPVHDMNGLTIVHKTKKRRKKAQTNGQHVLGYAKMVALSLPLVFSKRFYETVKGYHPFTTTKIEGQMEDHTHNGFPYYEFISDHEGVPLSESEHYHIYKTAHYKKDGHPNLKTE